MDLVYAEIELINAVDQEMARRNMIDAGEVRSMHLEMMVDNGAYMLAINENILTTVLLNTMSSARFS